MSTIVFFFSIKFHFTSGHEGAKSPVCWTFAFVEVRKSHSSLTGRETAFRGIKRTKNEHCERRSLLPVCFSGPIRMKSCINRVMSPIIEFKTVESFNFQGHICWLDLLDFVVNGATPPRHSLNYSCQMSDVQGGWKISGQEISGKRWNNSEHPEIDDLFDKSLPARFHCPHNPILRCALSTCTLRLYTCTWLPSSQGRNYSWIPDYTSAQSCLPHCDKIRHRTSCMRLCRNHDPTINFLFFCCHNTTLPLSLY